MLCQLPSAHARHHDIGQKELDQSGLLRRQQAGFDPVFGFENPVAQLSQFISHERTDTWVILHQENRFRTSLRLSHGLGRRCGEDVGLDARKIQVEACAVAHSAGDVDGTAALGDNRKYRREAQTAALSLPFRGEEWFEDMGLCVAIHATAGIADG